MLKQLTKNIKIFCSKVINEMSIQVPENPGNWVIDVMINLEDYTVNSDEIKFIIELVELNTFGAELPAGSILFSWITDKKILYNTNENITELRITIP